MGRGGEITGLILIYNVGRASDSAGDGEGWKDFAYDMG